MKFFKDLNLDINNKLSIADKVISKDKLYEIYFANHLKVEDLQKWDTDYSYLFSNKKGSQSENKDLSQDNFQIPTFRNKKAFVNKFKAIQKDLKIFVKITNSLLK